MLSKLISIFKKSIKCLIRKLFGIFKQRKETILITGYVHEDKLQFLLEKVYKIHGNYEKSKTKYESNDYEFILYFGLERGDFDRQKFSETCRSINRLKAIICLEHLNPRSNSLKGNLEEMRIVFTADELREKLYVFFTFGTSTTPSSLEKLREEVLDFNEMFRMLYVQDKKSFVDERAWILDLIDRPIPCPDKLPLKKIIFLSLILVAIISIYYHM